LGVGYTRGLTDEIEMDASVERLYCTGSGWGACSARLAPVIALRYAALAGPQHRLVFGAAIDGFIRDWRAWARLKLVVPARFSFEVEPLLVMGVDTRRTAAWWNPAVTQDGNQSRLSVVFDANVQLGEHFIAWFDGIPYAPTALLDDLSATALQVGGGVTLAMTKGLDVSASCWNFNVLPARRWEYLPDVRECALNLVVRRFGPSPENDAPSPDLY
jgi:hypothetical protein